MHVLQLFDSLVVGEDVEVVVPSLPEGSRCEALGDGEFERLQGLRECGFVIQRFADEEMNVLGHDNVAKDLEVVTLTREFEGVEEGVF